MICPAVISASALTLSVVLQAFNATLSRVVSVSGENENGPNSRLASLNHTVNLSGLVLGCIKADYCEWNIELKNEYWVFITQLLTLQHVHNFAPLEFQVFQRFAVYRKFFLNIVSYGQNPAGGVGDPNMSCPPSCAEQLRGAAHARIRQYQPRCCLQEQSDEKRKTQLPKSIKKGRK